MRFRYLLIYMYLLFGSSAIAENDPLEVKSLDEGAQSPAAKIEDISWLTGHWSGSGLGGAAEDLIAPAAGGEMMGMFRHLKADGSVNFYEFYVFAEKDGSLTQRLKHYSPPLSGWEEKDEFVEFPLVEVAENAVYFDGLTYLLRADGSLKVGVRVAEDKIAVFDYQRVK